MNGIKTEVKHSQSKNAWNIVGISIGRKYKIAICPYIVTENERLTTINKNEAMEHALFISKAFNCEKTIINLTNCNKKSILIR